VDVDDFPDEDDMTGAFVRYHHAADAAAAAAESAVAAHADDDDATLNHPSAKHLHEIPELLFPQRALTCSSCWFRTLFVKTMIPSSLMAHNRP